ncbi:hypothetical protein AMS68_002639 [Peltaster fructicola]|uniref:Rhodopsin domain-containing protein n=1 Tax=Peltaster fructicola TaxID=286661 RepID=A0A6H0XQS5_9PEZI|nr:hypothetical protein AMS68_002639 [Peltaster fructicola]
MVLPFNVESWIWFAVVMWVGLSRFVSRRLVLGYFKAFQWDDYIMILALAFYTTLIVTINIVALTSSNLLEPGTSLADMSQDEIDERVYGSKLILVVEECQCCVIWAAKACLAVMYLRFTVLAKENLMIKILLGYIAGGFVLMEILYLGVWCRPFSEYWAVPTDNVQCNAATDHLITNAVLNLTSDLAMLLIGLPIFVRVQVPLRQKIPLVLLFSLGIFVIIAAILNKIYSFTNPFGDEWVFWYVRESSTALIVANMPFVWGLYRKLPCFQLRTIHAKGTVDDLHSPRKQDGSFGMSNVTKSKHSSSATDADFQAARANVTAEEWLRDDYMASDVSRIHGEVNPYTHPALYYAQLKQQQQKQNHTVDVFGSAGETAQQVDRPGIIPELDASSGAPYLDQSASSSNRKRSFGSFV